MALSVVASLIRRRPRLLGGRGFGFGERSFIRSLATQQQPSQPPPPPLTSSIPPLLLVSTDAGDSRYLYKITKDEKHDVFNLYPHQHDLIINRQIIPGSHIIGSCHGFLICASSPGEDMRAFNPLTGASLDLPPAPAHFDIKESKVVLSPSLDKAVLLHTRRGDEMGKAEFTRLPSTSSSSWIPLPFPFPTSAICMSSCVFHKDHIFVMDDCGDFFIFNDNLSATSLPLVWKRTECLSNDLEVNGFYFPTLVESPDGDNLYFLYHLSDCPHMRTLCFKVAKLDERNNMWNQVTSIGDLAIFAGRTNTIALRASDFPFLEPNAIYFHNIHNQDYSSLLDRLPTTIYDTGVYCLKDGSLQLFEVTSKHGKVLDFPPPIWFKPVAASF